MEAVSATTEATRFGKYELVARLATGGMAEIFLARLQGLAGFSKLVCIKRILPHLARDRQFVAMFLDEARLAARISHVNVCQVFELGESDGSYYIAMEYLEGVPLSVFKRGGEAAPPTDPRLIAGIAVQACEGLHHVHELRDPDGRPSNIVHRDISPQNLFATVDGIAKVLDFGIAKIQDATMRTNSGAIKGKLTYLSPEQLRGEPLDRRSDVFAMGIVLWESLTRRHLFKRDTDFLTFQAITSDAIPDVRELRADVPAGLAAVVATALSRDRAKRFLNARALGEAIANSVPPLVTSAISAELARGFPELLRGQATLIQLARSGGALPLDAEHGPTAGHGTLSGAVGSSVDLRSASASHATVSAATQSGLPRPSDRAMIDIPRQPGDAVAADLDRADADPRRARRRRAGVLGVATLALVVVICTIVYVVALRPRTHGAPVVAVVAPDPVARPAALAPVDAVRSEATPITELAPAAVLVDAGAQPDAPLHAEAAAPADHHPAKPAREPTTAAKPSGPPGFVTFDSTPVFAVIYIDGKSYGETPVANVALSPGEHRIHAVAPSGTVRDFKITIAPGKVAPAQRIEW